MRNISNKNQFKVIITQDGDGYFVASVPALPGCYTQAKNLPDLQRRIREVIQLCLEESRANAKYRARIQSFAYDPLFIGLETVNI